MRGETPPGGASPGGDAMATATRTGDRCPPSRTRFVAAELPLSRRPRGNATIPRNPVATPSRRRDRPTRGSAATEEHPGGDTVASASRHRGRPGGDTTAARTGDRCPPSRTRFVAAELPLGRRPRGNDTIPRNPVATPSRHRDRPTRGSAATEKHTDGNVGASASRHRRRPDGGVGAPGSRHRRHPDGGVGASASRHRRHADGGVGAAASRYADRPARKPAVTRPPRGSDAR